MSTGAAPDRRALLVAGLLMVLSAAGLWGAAVADWYRVSAQAPLRGPVAVSFTGAQILPALTGLALLVLAAVAALVALAGIARRILGGLLAVAGAMVAGSAALSGLDPPFDSDAVDPSFPEPPPGLTVDALRFAPTEVTAAPWLAVAAGLLAVAAGVLVLTREQRLPRLGARYAAPGARRPAVDPDRAAWDALDAGRDPTDPVRPAGSDRLVGPGDRS